MTIDPNETMTLSINGQKYDGWTEISVQRSLEHMATHFEIAVTERWAGHSGTWQIKPFDACEIRIGKDLLLTGYVDDYDPGYTADTHHVRIRGRSKTMDVIDCTPDLKGGQFNGYTLDKLAKAVCAPFKVNVVVEVDVGAPFPDATIERHETGFQFLERLARQRSVLLTDNEKGELVITRAGASRASDRLVQGINILEATARLSGARRFSEYRVKGQTGEGNGGLNLAPIDGAPTSALVTQAPVVVDGEGIARDPDVPRYRPHVVMAETALDAKGKQARADWQMRYNKARGTQTHITVQGWRQSGGELWRTNHLVSVKSSFLQIDQELLIATVHHHLNLNTGRTTQLILGPVDGYTPDPTKIRRHTGSGGGISGLGLVPINQPDGSSTPTADLITAKPH